MNLNPNRLVWNLVEIKIHNLNWELKLNWVLDEINDHNNDNNNITWVNA